MLGLGLALNKTNVRPPYVLQTIPPSRVATGTGISEALSVRKLRSSSLYAMRVRRSSDDAHANIGFIGENLDEAALLAHCNGGSGYIQTWYAQDGNTGNDFVQNTAAYQPRIVNAGVIDRDFDAAKCAALFPTFASSASANILTGTETSGFVDLDTNYVADGYTAGSSLSGKSISAGIMNFIGSGTLAASANNRYSIASKLTVNRRYMLCITVKRNNSVGANTLELGSGATVAGAGTFTLTTSYVRYYTLCTATDTPLTFGAVNTLEISVQSIEIIDVTAYGRPAAYLDGSNDVMTKPLYPDDTQAAALYPTFASAGTSAINVNGNFSNGVTGYGKYASTTSASNGVASVTGDGTSNLFTIDQNTNVATAGKLKNRFYFSAKIRAIDVTNLTNLKCAISGSTSGNATTFIQSIVSAGTWYTLSGVFTPVIDWVGNFKLILFATYSTAENANGKVFEVKEVILTDVTPLDTTNILGAPLMLNGVFNSAATTNWILNKNGAAANEIQYGIVQNVNSGIDTWLETTAKQLTGNNTAPILTQKIFSSTFTTAVQKGFLNGVSSGADGNTDTTLTNRANMQLGARSNNAGGTAWIGFFKGYISELIIATDTTKRSKIEANQMKYFAPK
jgi:hypothetical protein